MELIEKNQLPPNVPPVPRGYKLFAGEDEDLGKVFAQAPADKRKSKGRVPAGPKLFCLMQDQEGKLTWEQVGETRQTIPIRNFMIEQGLRSEILFNMRLTGKAPKCSTILRQEFGMQGTPVSLYVQWCKFKGYAPNTKITEMALAEGEVA